MRSAGPVLVTGSCGSIGSSLCRLLNGASRLDVRETSGERVDVRDAVGVERVIRTHRPGVVIHAAANKYVDYLECHEEEAFSVNVLGTRNVVRACLKYGVQKMLLVSTDKANNPVSVLGRSKRAAEVYTLLSGFSAIRLVNVYESSGNVVEIFRKQVASRVPVTVTDPGMTRYFISMEEACHSILAAAGSAMGGDLFYVPGKLTRILDLAREVVGREDVPIVITSPRPGDKMEEESPVPEGASPHLPGLWRSSYSAKETAEDWIAPMLLRPSKEVMLSSCQRHVLEDCHEPD